MCVSFVCMSACVYAYVFAFPSRVVLSDCVVIGPTITTTLNAEVRQKIYQQFHTCMETASVFYRASVKGETYYS